MKEWAVHLRAQIDDHLVVEAETEEEAREAAEQEWSFTEAHSWETVSVEETKESKRREALSELTRLSQEFPGGYR